MGAEEILAFAHRGGCGEILRVYFVHCRKIVDVFQEHRGSLNEVNRPGHRQLN